MSEAKFLWEMERRLVENKKLQQGGLPKFLAPMGYVVGVYPWQVLVGLSALICGVVFGLKPEWGIEVVRKILLMGE